jgi:uncharacterized protein DUF4062
VRIFISSTFKDLRPERQAAMDVLHRAEFVPWGMELFVSEPSKPLSVALRELQLSDAVVLIIGSRAGSLIPESADLTYTRAEFDRALELGKPIFVFFQTDGGAWRNKETTTELRDALDNFKNAVLKANLTPAYFENPDKLQVELLVALQRWNSQGRPGARLTFTSAEEFFAPFRSATPRLFDYKQTLRGRGTEIEALNAFWVDREPLVGVLTGRGGIGKSKLLHDWASAAAGSVLYVRDDAVWHPEAAKEVPAGDVVIIADDAQRFDFLNYLAVLVRNLAQHQKIKLVLSTRPSGSSQIDAALAARFEPNQVRRFPPLERVTRQSVIELAQESLGPGHAQYAAALAAVSADTPLVTVVGGRLIARGDIPPALLANEEEFRRAVFDRFAAEYERLLPAGPVDWRQLLNLIAAVGPLAPNTNEFKNPAAEILRLRPDEIVQAMDRLEQHGLLLRGGRIVRIVPDLLSNFLLEGACLTNAGEATGFADLVFQKFQPTYVSNILRNLGELDWRITQRDQFRVTSLLDRIWTEIKTAFEAADAAGRVQILEYLEQAALFQPAHVMALIRQAMETEAAEVEVLSDWKITQENVLREIPPLLRAISFHLDHFEEATGILWRLAQRDTRAPHQYPEHARRVLEDMARYERYKPVDFNDRMVDFATALSQRRGVFDAAFTPLDIADELLAKEGQFTESEGFTISFGGFPLNYAAIKPVRDKAIALIQSCLDSEDAKTALRAVKSLSHILSGFLPAVVRQASEEELAWQDGERETALQIIESRLRRAMPIPLLRQIRFALRQVRPHTRENAIRQRIDAVLASIPQSDELLIFDAFCTGDWEHDTQFDNLEDANRAREEVIARAVETFQRMYPGAREQVAALIGLVADAESYGIDLDGKPHDFIEGLTANAEFRDAFLHNLLHEMDDSQIFLAQMVYIPLRRLRSLDSIRYRDIGLQAARHNNPYLALGTANAVSIGPNLNAPIPVDLTILEALSQHPVPRVRHLTFTGIRRIGAHAEYEREAINLLLRSDIGDNAALAEELCGTLTYAGIPLDHLSEADVRSILQKLVLTKEIDDHHIGLVLQWIGQNRPALLCEFIIARLDHHARMQERGEAANGYTPVPHHRFGNAFHALQGTPQYQDFLIQIRDRFVTQSDQRYWLRELFWAIGTVDATTLSALDELLHSGDKEKTRTALDLIEQAPPELALTRPFFAIHVIEEAKHLDADLGERATGVLISNTAHSGSFNRTAGQPSPRYLGMKDRAAALRDSFPNGSTGWTLFSKIYESALAALERERVDDEEIRFR